MHPLNAKHPAAGTIPPGTDIGHVHLKVSSIDRALDFYCGVLGFELMTVLGDSAAFVSAGGYHHHLGLNTWAGIGAPPPPEDAVGLRSFTVESPALEPRELTDETTRVSVIFRKM
jgi:catechol 2,3-dioxygenase